MFKWIVFKLKDGSVVRGVTNFSFTDAQGETVFIARDQDNKMRRVTPDDLLTEEEVTDRLLTSMVLTAMDQEHNRIVCCMEGLVEAIENCQGAIDHLAGMFPESRIPT